MDIRKSLESEHSRAMTTRIVNYVGDDQERYDTLINIVFAGSFTLAQRAAWAVGDLGESSPQLISKHIGNVLKKLHEEKVHDAVRRNLMKALQFIDVPEKHLGELLDLCYGYIKSELVPVAIRAYAMTVAVNICKRFPDLKDEFRIILLELNALTQPPGIRVRIREALKNLA